jgi:hypothetical protein
VRIARLHLEPASASHGSSFVAGVSCPDNALDHRFVSTA